MHDSESDTFIQQTWPEKFSSMLKEIGVDSESKDIATDAVETDDYYSRYLLKLLEWLLTKVVLILKILTLTSYK